MYRWRIVWSNGDEVYVMAVSERQALDRAWRKHGEDGRIRVMSCVRERRPHARA